MRRRGPDTAERYRFAFPPGREAVLLHSRLSIIDLDPRANQPFRFGSRVLIFNGEIYNYVELRRDLERHGPQFKTESDTEVLIRILAEFGWQGLDRCEGMWAFALFDESDGSLLLSRDRFGEKPLTIFHDPAGLYFGSEVKFAAALRGERFDVNYAHLYRYLVNGYKALYKTGDTFFRDVGELTPGTVLRIDADGRSASCRYWKPSFAEDHALTYADAVAGVRDAVVNSVRLRLRADVPLAFCMSGGIDSNSLISTAKRVCGYDVHGFTVMSDDARYDERGEIETAVRELGIRHTAVPITADGFRENIRLLVRQHDAPVYTISYYLHWLLMAEIAKAGYRVSISGTGADELLTGYYDHHNLYLSEVEQLQEYLPALGSWEKYIAPLVRNPYLKNPQLYLENPAIRDHIYLDAADFADYLKVPWHEPFMEADYCESLLRNRMLNEMFHESIPVILHEDDLNAMFFSIENRSPFLDRRLFELCSRIPTRYLIRDGYTKVVLRDAMRGIVPDAVLDNRRKVGFNAPVTAFLKIERPDVRAYLLEPSPVFDHVRRERIEALVSQSNELPNSQSKFLFYFLNAKVFLEEFGP